MKILISGSTGFVGTNLISSPLFSNYQFETIGRNEKSNYRWDDFNGKQTEAEIWIHLAGKAHDVKGISKLKDYLTVNLDLTIKLFKEFVSCENAKVFIFFSSVKAAAEEVNGELNEDYEGELVSPYGISKRRAEKHLLSVKLPKGKKVVILRPCMIHGPGNKGNLNLLFNLTKRSIPYPFGAFDNKRSMVGIHNLLFYVDKIIQKPELEGGIFNMADDETISTNQVIKLMNQVGPGKSVILKFPKQLIFSLVWLGDLLNLPLNKKSFQKLTENYIVSNKKINKSLDIDRLPFSISDNLISTLKSIR